MTTHTQPPATTLPSTPEAAHTATMPSQSPTVAVESTQQHSRRTSSASSDVIAEDLEKQDHVDTMPPAQPIKSTTESIYPGGKERTFIIIALILSIFLVALDRTIIATAIPKITDDFNSLDDIGWYGSAFLLTSCCFQLLFGRIYTFNSPKYVFLALIGLFEVGSLVCGAAPNSVAFIVGRAIAGMGAAGIMSGAIVLMVGIVPLAKRPKFQGLFGACFGLASIIGPLLGGAFTTDVSWRWCFYINLPIGGVVMAIIFFTLKPTEPVEPGLSVRQQLARLDLLGEFFLLPSVVCLLLALQWGGSTYAWSDGRVIALLVLFPLLAVAFAAVQVLRPETATISLRVIRNRTMLAAMWFILCQASAMMLMIFYLPIWFQAIRGVSAVQSGINTLPLVLSLVVGTIGTGQAVGRIGYYTPFMIASACIVPIGIGLITTFDLHTSEGKWIGFQILLGLGLGMGMQQANIAAQTVLDKKDVPTGISLIFFCQMLGGAIFISVGQNVFDAGLISGLTKIVKELNPMEVVNTGATDLRRIVPAKDLQGVLTAYNGALHKVFVLALVMSCLTILGAVFVEFRSVKGKQGSNGGEAGAEQERTERKEEV